MEKAVKLGSGGVKQAGFYVPGGAAMQAILIEIGFLTNRKEERKLATPEHREAIARAIYSGLAEYKRRYDQRLRTAQSQPAKGGPTRRPPICATTAGDRLSSGRSRSRGTTSATRRARSSSSSA